MILNDPTRFSSSPFKLSSRRKFDAEDAGIYVASIYIEKDGESFKCDVEVKLVLLGKIRLFSNTIFSDFLLFYNDHYFRLMSFNTINILIVLAKICYWRFNTMKPTLYSP